MPIKDILRAILLSALGVLKHFYTGKWPVRMGVETSTQSRHNHTPRELMDERNAFQIAVDDTKIVQFRDALNSVLAQAPEPLSILKQSNLLYDFAHDMTRFDITAHAEWPKNVLLKYITWRQELIAYRETKGPGYTPSDAEFDAAVPLLPASDATVKLVEQGIEAVVETARQRRIPDSVLFNALMHEAGQRMTKNLVTGEFWFDSIIEELQEHCKSAGELLADLELKRQIRPVPKVKH